MARSACLIFSSILSSHFTLLKLAANWGGAKTLRAAAQEFRADHQAGRDRDQQSRDRSQRRIDIEANLLPHPPRQGDRRRSGQKQRDEQLVEGGDEGEDRAGEDARPDQRQGDLSECRPRARSQTERRIFETAVDAIERRGHIDHDEGHGKRRVAEDESQRSANEPIARVSEIEADRDNDARRNYRREDQRVHELLARKLAAHEANGRRRSEERRERGDSKTDPDAEPGGIRPGGAGEEIRVPLQAEAGRRERHIFARGEGQRDHDQDGEQEIGEDQDHEGVKGDAPDRAHQRWPWKIFSILMTRVKPPKMTSTTARSTTAMAAAWGQSRMFT